MRRPSRLRLATWAGLLLCVLVVALYGFAFCEGVLGVEPSQTVFVGIEVSTALFGILLSRLIWRDRRRRLPGHCKKCGYDLRGNVSGRCPECGDAAKGSPDAHT